MENEKIIIKTWHRKSGESMLTNPKSFTYEVDSYPSRPSLDLLNKISQDVLQRVVYFEGIFGYAGSKDDYKDRLVVMISVDEPCISSVPYRFCDLVLAYLKFIEFGIELEIMIAAEEES